MIFPFDTPRQASFWMKNTLIPLDMIFIRADGSIANIAANTVPLSLEPVYSEGNVAAVLEIAGGRVGRTWNRARRQGRVEALTARRRGEFPGQARLPSPA